MNKINILIIEDNTEDTELTKEALECETCNYCIYVVSDGEMAMQFLNREKEYNESPRPSIIFLDLNLPKMSGKEVLYLIKSNKEFKNIPVVVLTTSDNEKDVYEAYSMHANCYIRKPMDFNVFKEYMMSVKKFWLSTVRLPKE